LSLWIEALQPLRVHKQGTAIDLQPGRPVEFDDADGQKLLERAPGKVKLVDPGSCPLFPVGAVVRVSSMNGHRWVGEVTLTLYQPPGGTTKAGWWACVRDGARWSFVHETLLDQTDQPVGEP